MTEKTETEKAIEIVRKELKEMEVKIDEVMLVTEDGAYKLHTELSKLHDDLLESIDSIEGGITELEERDLEWYLEEHPDQVLDVMIPEETCQALWRAKIIDTSESDVLNLRTLCEMLERD